MADVRVKMRTSGAGPDIPPWGAGATITVDEEKARRFIDAGYGELIAEASSGVDEEAAHLMLKTKAELLALAEANSVGVQEKWPKPQIVHALRAAGVTVPAELETAADAGAADEQESRTDGPQPRERVPVEDGSASGADPTDDEPSDGHADDPEEGSPPAA